MCCLQVFHKIILSAKGFEWDQMYEIIQSHN